MYHKDIQVYDSEHSVGYVNAHYRQLVSHAVAMGLYHITTKTTEALIGTPLESVHHWHSYIQSCNTGTTRTVVIGWDLHTSTCLAYKTTVKQSVKNGSDTLTSS